MTLCPRYDELKALAGDHLSAKLRLRERLVQEGCGRWVVKPVEQDQFLMGWEGEVEGRERQV